jgi:hypothetical protein
VISIPMNYWRLYALAASREMAIEDRAVPPFRTKRERMGHGRFVLG